MNPPATLHQPDTGGESGDSGESCHGSSGESGDSWRVTSTLLAGCCLLLQVPVQLAQVVITHALGTWALDLDVVAQKRIFSELR